MMTDPIADMLTRIRNAIAIERTVVEMPTSKVKVGIAEVLKREGYIWDFEVVENPDAPRNVLRIDLKYGPNGERVIRHIKRFSKPGLRKYAAVRDMPDILDGLGISIVSTSHGMLSNREAKAQNVGGEVLATIW
jgi:small subunit ribosomal protein S8